MVPWGRRPVKLYEPPRRLDPRPLLGVHGFVVERQRFGRAHHAGHAPGVAGVCTPQLLRGGAPAPAPTTLLLLLQLDLGEG